MGIKFGDFLSQYKQKTLLCKYVVKHYCSTLRIYGLFFYFARILENVFIGLAYKGCYRIVIYKDVVCFISVVSGCITGRYVGHASGI